MKPKWRVRVGSARGGNGYIKQPIDFGVWAYTRRKDAVEKAQFLAGYLGEITDVQRSDGAIVAMFDAWGNRVRS